MRKGGQLSLAPHIHGCDKTALCLLRIVLPGSEEAPLQSKGLYKDGMAAAHSRQQVSLSGLWGGGGESCSE